MDDHDILERIEKLERDSHPPIGLCEFEGFQELKERIDAIEEKLEKCMSIMLQSSKS